ncbi:ATP-binding cassette domain-containing protein [Candidatus Sororendozoicomonas aggregata]|uniref:ATP-binding cassette domain-containing protein n=1 Tax=Candidatus Sororendozoicomonas aggregata TaxID=3073239 RepID=UPI002ED422C1
MTLNIKDITLSVEGNVLFQSVSFDVAGGQVFSIMGQSGCGKSSLLSLITGTLDTAFTASGCVLLNGCDITHQAPHKRCIGIQFQDHLLFPHMTVGENLAFGIPERFRAKERKAMVIKALNDCGMAGFENQNPATLSGGQRGRVSVMRTLLSEPEAVLLDEPFSKLDKELKAEFRQFVFDQVYSREIPTVMVTHDTDDVPDRSLMMRL